MVNFLVLIFCLFLFLFFLYYLTKDDFVILRRDLALDKVFSLVFLTMMVAIFFARLGFAIFSLRADFINPLVFLAIPYFPGLSLMSGVVGAGVFIYVYSVIKKISLGRLTDLFTMSLIGVFPIGQMLLMFTEKNDFITKVIMLIISIIIFILFAKIIFPFSTKGEIKDGSLSFIFTLILSFSTFTTKLFSNIKNFSFLDPVNIFTLFVFFSSIVLIINQEVVNKYLPKK